MKVRVYEDKRKLAQDFFDRVSIYFPLPARLKKEARLAGMLCAGHFNPNGGFNGLYWDEVEDGTIVNSNEMYLGKPIKREDLPDKVRNKVEQAERIWNDACKHGKWEEWRKVNLSC